MRRLTSLVAVAALLAMLLPATAAAAIRTTEHITSLVCGIQSDLGTLSMFAQDNTEFGPFAEAVYWEPGVDPETDPATLYGFDGVVTATSGGLTGAVPMFDDQTGQPAGVLTFDAVLTPVGDPEAFSDSGRQGNHWFRANGTFQLQVVAGSATLDDVGEFDLATSCDGTTATITTVGNAPASFVNRFNDGFIGCAWETETDAMYLNIVANDFEGYSEFGTFTFDDSSSMSGFGEGSIGGGVFSATFEIFDDFTGEAIGTGSAEGTATLVGGRSRTLEDYGLGTTKIVSRTLAVEGTFTVEIDGAVEEIALDAEHCNGEIRDIHDKVIRPKGPRAKVLANDAPDGAIAVKLPKKILTNTALTSIDAEAPCIMELEEGDTIDVPIGSTAWWTFAGNGRNVTINTAGSSFDTVLAVYRLDGADLVQVECVDDVFDEETFSFLARTTIATEAGETYYIQAGGYADNSGRMQLTVR